MEVRDRGMGGKVRSDGERIGKSEIKERRSRETGQRKGRGSREKKSELGQRGGEGG